MTFAAVGAFSSRSCVTLSLLSCVTSLLKFPSVPTVGVATLRLVVPLKCCDKVIRVRNALEHGQILHLDVRRQPCIDLRLLGGNLVDPALRLLNVQHLGGRRHYEIAELGEILGLIRCTP